MKIDPEFRALIPAMSAEELAQLEANIVADGCRDPLVIWADEDTLIDGHNRFEICTRLGLPFETRAQVFDSRDDVKAWIIRNQFGRRNLSLFERSRLALLLEPLIVAEAKQRQREHGGTAPGKSLVPKSAQVISRTRDALSKVAGVSHDTIAKVKAIINEAPRELIEQVRSGETTINAAYKITRPASFEATRIPRVASHKHADAIPRCRSCGDPCKTCKALAS